jgi:hypothetical protein
MTAQQKNTIKDNWVNTTTLIAVLTFIAIQSQRQGSVDKKIEVLEQHAADKEEHPPYRERSQLFVPRVEIDGRLESIEKWLIKIDNKLDK